MPRPERLLLALCACQSTPAAPPPPAAADPIGWVTAALPTGSTVAQIPATVVAPQASRWVSGPPVPARLTRWRVTDGEQVSAGQPLATLISPELGDLAAVVAELDRVVEERARNVARLAEAVDAGFRAAEELYAAELALHEAEAERGRARRQLGGRGESVRSSTGSEWDWLAPVSGRISALRCSPGGLYDAASECLTILPEGEARLSVPLSPRQLAELEAPLHAGSLSARWTPEGGEPQRLQLDRCLPDFDPHTRSRACLFSGEDLRVGAAGVAELEIPPPAGAVTLPRQAVVRVGGQDTVFLRAEPPEARPVTVLGRQGGDLLVAGLEPDVEVAGRGAFTLKSRLALQ